MAGHVSDAMHLESDACLEAGPLLLVNEQQVGRAADGLM